MNYRVVLVETDEGFSVSCPALRGCHSQGKTRNEALENIRAAIREWLAEEDPDQSIVNITEEEVTIQRAENSGHQLFAGGTRFRKARLQDIIRQGKRIVVSDNVIRLTIPRHHPVNAYTMGAIAQDAGLTPQEFKELL